MTKKIAILAVALTGALALSASAVPISFNFQENGSGTLTASETFNESGFALTAKGYTTGGAPTALFAKNGGGDETGLGTDLGSDNEITTTNFIQLTLPTTPPSNFDLVLLGSVQSGERADIYFSPTAGMLGTLLGSLSADGQFTVDSAHQNGFISITAGIGNVLLNGAQVSPRSVPDAGFTASLLGMGLIGLAALRRKLKA